MKYHPDRNKHPKAAEVFKKMSAAYKILSNPDSKRKYEANPTGNVYNPNQQQQCKLKRVS